MGEPSKDFELPEHLNKEKKKVLSFSNTTVSNADIENHQFAHNFVGSTCIYHSGYIEHTK